VRFVHRSGQTGQYYLPEVVAGGVALLDADEDGRLDVYFVQSGSLVEAPESRPGNALYRNLGGWRFEDRSAGSGADDRGYGIGAATGDADGDGHVDLYVTNVGPNALLSGRGDLTFADVTEEAGVGDPGFGSSAAFFDYDADGDLDLYVANYLIWSPETERTCFDGLGQRDYCAPAKYNAPAIDVLYRNEGDGRFTDVSATAGLETAFGTGLGVACGDFDGDGRSDVFVANDGRVDQLWINLGDGRFEDRALFSGCAMDQDGIAKAGMGVAVADIDDDGDLDLLIGNLRGETDSLFLNRGGTFDDVTAARGLGRTSRSFTRFGHGWVDFDDDGRLDLYQACGRVSRDTEPHDPSDPLAEPNLLFRGTGDGTFALVEPRAGTAGAAIHTSRGAAFGDLDDDGGIDVVVVNKDAAPYVLRNRVADRGHWLLVRVLDERGSDAIGAVVTVRLGERTLRRDVRTAYGYCSAHDPRVHFGLGATSRVETLVVRWVDGTTDAFPVGAVDRALVVRRPE